MFLCGRPPDLYPGITQREDVQPDMVFSSITFLFRFLPIAFLLYYITPKKFKNFVLLVESLIFYAWGEVRYLPIMIFSMLLDYTVSNLIDKYRGRTTIMKWLLAVSMVGNLGMLVFFKYTNFLLGNIGAIFGLSIPELALTLPLGISFYTFQTMSYTIDVYRGRFPAEKSFVSFGAFVALFPQLIAGPIVRYSDVKRELSERTMNPRQISDGMVRFITGLGKKVLIANSVGSLWTEVSQMAPADISGSLAWLGVLAFGLQIYFDFSGYSDMAIGLGKMLGFDFPENFNLPYTSKSITEFWRRWHMTLGSWFKDYLYFPLGGSRCEKKWRNYFNLFVVWAATGLWHGASWNFLLWGLLFFVFLVLEKTFLLPYLEKSRVWSRIYVLFILMMGWALFAITDLPTLGSYVGRMFAGGFGVDTVYYLRNYAVILVLGIFLSTVPARKLYQKIMGNRIIAFVFLAVVLVFSVAYLADATYNPFLYFRF